MSESTIQQLSLYDISAYTLGLNDEDDDEFDREGGGRNGEEGGLGGGDADNKEGKEEEEEWLKEETESEREARKQREKEEEREYEEELRRDKERRSKLDKLSLKGTLLEDDGICCSELCGKITGFHHCACLAPVRQDPIPYDALLEKRKLEHPEWYVDPYGLDDDDYANKVMRMLMGEVSAEEADRMVDNLMMEEEDKKEQESREDLSRAGSEPEPLSRASSPGSFDLAGSTKDNESSIFDEEDEEYRWPTCREWTVDLGLTAIEDFIQTRWNLPDHYKFCVDFLGSVTGPPEQYVEDFYFRAKFSVPSRLEPIPLQRAAVHFLVSVMLHHDRPKEEKVYVAYYLESKRTRLSAETPFKLEWLQMVMENKHRLADDWGSKKTNLYQYVLDGPESEKKKESLPLSSTDSQGFWIPNY